MSIYIILILMIFAHIVDDFYLQGILANMKQKSWWQKQTDNKLYKYDYIVALIIHACSWSIMILLPIFFAIVWNPHWVIYIVLTVNIIIHAVVDDLKANKQKINLITDQTIHFIQIVITWLVWVLY